MNKTQLGETSLLKRGFEYNEDKDYLYFKWLSFTFHADDSNQFTTVSIILNKENISVRYLEDLDLLMLVLTGIEI